MQIQTQVRVNRLTASVRDLASDYKWRGLTRHEAWNEFIKDRSLKPNIDAKKFMSIFDDVSAVPLVQIQRVEFSATHHDTLKEIDVQITRDGNGVFFLVWADGSTGSNPPTYPPEPERFIMIDEAMSP